MRNFNILNRRVVIDIFTKKLYSSRICQSQSYFYCFRAHLPLPIILSLSEIDNPAFEVPFFQYDPRVLGIQTEHRHMANIPGTKYNYTKS